MKQKILSSIPVLCIMILIFIFSSRPAVQSTKDSMMISKVIYNAYTELQKDSNIEDQTIMINQIDHIVRKTAHAFIYFTLCITIVFHLKWYHLSEGNRCFLSVFLTFSYACTDEYHQLFVPGRSGEFKDVMIDTSGAIVGVLFFLLCQFIWIKRGRRKTK